VTGNLEPISAYVNAPHNAIIPPATHAKKKTFGVSAALAASDDVLKIPNPITNPITIIVSEKRFNLFDFMGGR